MLIETDSYFQTITIFTLITPVYLLSYSSRLCEKTLGLSNLHLHFILLYFHKELHTIMGFISGQIDACDFHNTTLLDRSEEFTNKPDDTNVEVLDKTSNGNA